MDVVIFVLVLLALTAYVAAPLYRPSPADGAPRTGVGRREAVIGALRELEWDRREGLVEEGEYRSRRRELEAEAVEVWSIDPGPAND